MLSRRRALKISVCFALCLGTIFLLWHCSKPRVQLLPYEDPFSDRIINQLRYTPPNYDQLKTSSKLKTILLYNGLETWNVKQGREVFIQSKCRVDTCELTANRGRAKTADLILYKDSYIPTGILRSANSSQLTMIYYLESPYHTEDIRVPNAITWTATYRRDSDIVAPYAKWQYYNRKFRQIDHSRNFAANKTKKVAWFVSNCITPNRRLQLALEMQKYIEVDIYGECGDFQCPRLDANKCLDMLERDYKFYLAFENANCKDYITEKLFLNALSRNILPIVWGARPEDYAISAPYRSYIHVDEFKSTKELVQYLHILDKDDELYNSYFKWKGTGQFMNTFYWCRVCAVLHYEKAVRKPRWYKNLNDWWKHPGVCRNSSWRNFEFEEDIIAFD